jgi:hypothetical protein
LSIAEGLEALAATAYARGDVERAGVLVGAADALWRDRGGESYRPQRAPKDVPTAARRAGAGMSFDEAVAFALASMD